MEGMPGLKCKLDLKKVNDEFAWNCLQYMNHNEAYGGFWGKTVWWIKVRPLSTMCPLSTM